MARTDKLQLAFLWHMHQPYYRNLKDKYFQMPWVRLHGIKDYYDMVAILDDFPKIKQTFNLVPSLIEQIEEYIEGGGSDRHLELSRKKAGELNDTEKNEILSSFFSAHHPTMIQPYPRYRQLLDKSFKGIGVFDDKDFTDLQVWSNLTWFDPIFRGDSFISGLIKKGKGFTGEEKNKLLDRQIEILKSIIPKYKEVQDRGQIEVSITPYYHPILPLLCDTDLGRKSDPNLKLPENRFQHPEDADYQIREAVEFYRQRFGRDPRGMWPSEGSVANEIIPLISKYGIKWIATDEEVLARSIGRSPDRNDSNNVSATGELYRAYKLIESPDDMSIIFRDHTLSDRLGFVYANWNPEDAAADFVDKLMGLKSHLNNIGASNRLIPVILDGENAWEYYLNDGNDFFRALYTKLSEHPEIETCTISQYLENNGDRGEIKNLHPGSWINHNYNVWIGHEEDNLAWDLLYKTRKTLEDFQNSDDGKNFNEEKLKLAWREIYIAEGSDWCWWFGDEHQGANNDQFDSLFRSNLIYIYELLGKEVPQELLKPIRSNFLSANILMPTDYIEPIIDGRNSNFYEWYSSGYFDCTKAGSTMHRAIHHTRGVYFGFDDENLFLRVDPDNTLEHKIFRETTFKFEFLSPAKLTIIFNGNDDSIKVINGKEIEHKLKAALDTIFEIKIPMSVFGDDSNFQFDFRLIVSHNEQELEVWPPVDVISFKLPTAAPDSIFW
ncbi:MAG: glycoside hydrolase [candidate division Zixibacteria bacterium]|nr:glycoside hydrolase [candidate division Zixibacteria bacterium]